MAKKFFKKILSIFIIIIFTLVTFDILIYFLLPKIVQEISPSYKNSYGRGYPQNHFVKNDLRGFDIRPNFSTKTSTKPIELGEYKVWGNEIGCFDDSIKRLKEIPLKKIIYLAGDSYTWGYAPFDKKFGFFLEKNSKFNVMKCGVTHTGQIHQFLKFKEIYHSNYKPEIVIVNVTSNDVQNDFFFPHTAMIDGYMVENVQWCYLAKDKIFWKKIEYDLLEKKYLNMTNEKLIRFIKYYSATAQLSNIVFKNVSQSYLKIKQQKNNIKKNKNKCDDFFKTPYGFDGYDYDLSSFSLPNKKVIREWIDHSKKNNYILIFSLIGDGQHYKKKINYIKDLGGEIIIFDDWLHKEKIKDQLYWKNDGHFNLDGNRIYATFLNKKIIQ